MSPRQREIIFSADQRAQHDAARICAVGVSQEKLLPALAIALPLALLCAARLADLTQAMAEQAGQAFDANELVFRELGRTGVRGAALPELLTAICERLPHIRAITIRDPEGFVVASSGTKGARPFRMSAARRLHGDRDAAGVLQRVLQSAREARGSVRVPHRRR
jgi:hypothetical protein